MSTPSYCSLCRYSFVSSHLLSMCRTIARTCISSVACTPWYCSSLNCSARLVVYFSSNPLVLSTALPDIQSLLYLLNNCCISHTHLANTMWVSTHTPMLFITYDPSSTIVTLSMVFFLRRTVKRKGLIEPNLWKCANVVRCANDDIA